MGVLQAGPNSGSPTRRRLAAPPFQPASLEDVEKYEVEPMTQRHRPRFIGFALALLLSAALAVAACGGANSSGGVGPGNTVGQDGGSFDSGPAGSGDTAPMSSGGTDETSADY